MSNRQIFAGVVTTIVVLTAVGVGTAVFHDRPVAEATGAQVVPAEQPVPAPSEPAKVEPAPAEPEKPKPPTRDPRLLLPSGDEVRPKSSPAPSTGDGNLTDAVDAAAVWQTVKANAKSEEDFTQASVKLLGRQGRASGDVADVLLAYEKPDGHIRYASVLTAGVLTEITGGPKWVPVPADKSIWGVVIKIKDPVYGTAINVVNDREGDGFEENRDVIEAFLRRGAGNVRYTVTGMVVLTPDAALILRPTRVLPSQVPSKVEPAPVNGNSVEQRQKPGEKRNEENGTKPSEGKSPLNAAQLKRQFKEVKEKFDPNKAEQREAKGLIPSIANWTDGLTASVFIFHLAPYKLAFLGNGLGEILQPAQADQAADDLAVLLLGSKEAVDKKYKERTESERLGLLAYHYGLYVMLMGMSDEEEKMLANGRVTDAERRAIRQGYIDAKKRVAKKVRERVKSLITDEATRKLFSEVIEN
jgi:hypothetical protein